MSERPTILTYLAGREAWLAQVDEDVIDPGREIVDPHHHLWDRPDSLYELDALWADTGSGHNVVQTVFVQCSAYPDQEAPRHLRPVGETRAIAAMARASEAGPGATIAGIVGHADLRLPLTELDEVLDAHEDAGGGRFRGIRHHAAWLTDPDPLLIPGRAPEGLYADADFRRGVTRLGERGLSYDAWHYHTQNAEFLELALACPATVMILDHFGTPLGVGPYAGLRETRFSDWQREMDALASCPNVVAKLGGLVMPDNGFDWHLREMPPGSDELVTQQAHYYRHMIEAFGAERCMFESNFPVDKVSVGYRVLWNAFKKIAADYAETDQAALFAATARRIYRLPAAAG